MLVCVFYRLQTASLTRTLAKRGLRFASSVSTDETPYYDVVVAGGGVMGFSTAYHLATAAPNLKIAVVEKDSCVRRLLVSRSCLVIDD